MKQKFTTRNGNSLSYAEYGDRSGFPILVQHGLIASIEDAGLFERLVQNRARLICMARPGYGESSPVLMDSFAAWAGIVSPLVDALQLSQFDILGMSSGAPYSYALGCRYADRVRNVYIFSGVPALFDQVVRAAWPYPPVVNQTMAQVEAMAHELFFPNVTKADLLNPDIRDSMKHHGFGVAQDLILRFKPWGFSLSDLQAQVFMRHSKADDNVPYQTAVRTAQLIPSCVLELTEAGPHFSKEALDGFIEDTIVKHFKG
jgi:pimeloyl-ACP methyl ester carboxylesterase